MRLARFALHRVFGFGGPAAVPGGGVEDVKEGLADGGFAGDVVLIELGEGAVVGLDELVLSTIPLPFPFSRFPPIAGHWQAASYQALETWPGRVGTPTIALRVSTMQPAHSPSS